MWRLSKMKTKTDGGGEEREGETMIEGGKSNTGACRDSNLN